MLLWLPAATVSGDGVRRHGIEPTILPDKPFVMKKLVAEIVAALAP